MRSGPIHIDETPLLAYVLRRADDALVLGHRLSEWAGRAPSLEEDMALANMGLDLVGQARALYTYAGEIDGQGRDEDAFAYWRDERGFRNLLLLEQPNGDFAVTIARQFFYAAFAEPYWTEMQASRDGTLAAVAAKAAKEMAYHVRHCAEWVIRLGDGTAVSRERMTAAVAGLRPLTGEMFERDDVDSGLILAGVAVDPEPLHTPWRATVADVLAQAGLSIPEGAFMRTGGRIGRHGEGLGHMLAEMQILQRTHPGATW